MALSTVDAQPALVVIDLQKGILGLPGGAPTTQVIEHAAERAAAFRSHRLPVALVSILGDAPGRTEVSPPADFIPQPDWADPVLDAAVDRAGVHTGPGADCSLVSPAVR